MSANALRWDGRPGRYEVWYLTVAGRFWIRYTLHVPTDPDAEGECALWFGDFTGAPAMRRTTFPLEALHTPQAGWPLELGPGRLTDTEASGEVEGARWSLRFDAAERPFVYTPALVQQARPRLDGGGGREAGSGRLGRRRGRRRDPRARRRAGQQAHVFGRRHADRWGWFHATLDGGRWVEGLVAKVAGLPRVALHASERGARTACCTSSGLRPSSSRAASASGPYEVQASPSEFAGVTYRDPDGAEVYCYHAERARLRGPGVESRRCRTRVRHA